MSHTRRNGACVRTLGAVDHYGDTHRDRNNAMNRKTLGELRAIAPEGLTHTIGDDSMVVVWAQGAQYSPCDRGYRQSYAYAILTPTWQYDADDISSGVGAPANVNEGARALFSFLSAAIESAQASPTGENADMFPAHVMAWACENADDIESTHVDYLIESGEL